jgi:Trypsin
VRFSVLALALLSSSPALAVIGGTPLPATDPVGSQTVMVSGGQGFCSGTVIGDRLVLTAAHCVDGAPRLAVLVFGPNREPILNEITGRSLHPAYRRADWQNRRTSIDLAIIRTARPIGQGKRAARLSTGALPAAGTTIRLVGYGPIAEGDGASAGVLRTAALTVTGRPSTYQVRLIGAPGGKLGACTGDSGGPTFATETGEAVLAGVVSWSTGQGASRCGNLTGTVPIAPHRQWIETAIRSLGVQ